MRLSFKLGGEVKEVFFEESDRVQEGVVLARLDQTEIRTRTTQCKIEFDKAKRDLERIRT